MGILRGGCCCEPPTPGDPCEDCDSTPLNFRVTFSGITMCPNCVEVASVPIEYKFTDGQLPAPTGPYIVDQNSLFPCTWSDLVDLGTVSVERYINDSPCTGTPSDEWEVGLGIQIGVFTDPAGVLRVQGRYLVEDSPGSSANYRLNFFTGSTTRDPIDDCLDTYIIDNDNTSACGLLHIGYAGTATVVAV